MTIQPDIEGFRRQIAATIHAHWKLFLAQGILLMVFGLLAVAMPNIATLAVEIFVGSADGASVAKAEIHRDRAGDALQVHHGELSDDPADSPHAHRLQGVDHGL